MTKKLLLFFMLSMGFHNAQADNRTTHSNPYKSPLYLQLYGGINKSANEHLPWSEFSKYPWSGGMFVGLGQDLSSLWGWRSALRFNHNKSRSVQKCENANTWGWNNIGLFGDATFDLTNAFSKPKISTDRTFDLKAFAGVGLAYTFGFNNVPLSYTNEYSRNSRLLPGFRVGLDATWKIAPNWRIGAELSQTMFADAFNGVKANCPLDGRTNFKIGITYVLGKRKKKEPINEPIVYANRLREVPALPFMMPDNENVKKRKLFGRAFLDFPVNETIIYPRYRRNPQELRRIRATIDSALFDKTIVVTSISLHGYASPESPYSNNTRLAKGRTAALMGYLRKQYKVSEQLFHNTYTPEDWSNLRGFIANSDRRRVKGDIWYENASILETPQAPDFVLKHRDELLRTIDLNMDPDEKELLLKQVGGGAPYKWLLQHVYPGLRHTDYIIEYIVRSYPVKQARKLIYTHPEALSLKEMYAVAQSYEEGSDDWLDALMIAAREYPGDHTANLNAACACVKMKRLYDAKRFLKNAGNTPQALYLSDVISAMQGNCSWKLIDGKVIINEYKK